MKDVKQNPRMPEASEAGQMPPTDASPCRQRYHMATSGIASGGGDSPVSRQRTSSRQFNRGSAGKPRGY